MRKSLRFWRSASETHERLKSEADHAVYYFLIRRFLMKWNAKFLQLRKQKRKQLLEECVRNKKLKLLAKCIQNWRQRRAHWLDSRGVADEIRQDKDFYLVYDVFVHWKEQ